MQEWIIKELMSFFSDNLIKFAQINSEEFITQLSIEQVQDDAEGNYQKKHFTNEKEAKEWLLK